MIDVFPTHVVGAPRVQIGVQCEQRTEGDRCSLRKQSTLQIEDYHIGATRVVSNEAQRWTRENNPKGTALTTGEIRETPCGTNFVLRLLEVRMQQNKMIWLETFNGDDHFLKPAPSLLMAVEW